MLLVIVTSRPSLFFVVPGSRRIVRAAMSICPTLRLISSLIRHPYVRPISTIVWNQRSGQYAISFLYCASSRKPVRILSSVSFGNLGRRKTFGGVRTCRYGTSVWLRIVGYGGFQRHRQLVLGCDPSHHLRHQLRDDLGLRWHIDDAACPAVSDDVLFVTVGRGLGAGLAVTHDEGVQALNTLLRESSLAPGNTFHLLKGGMVSAYLLLVALAAREVPIFGDDLCDLLLGEEIALDHRRVVRRVQPSRLPQIRQHSRRDWQRLDSVFHRFNTHQAASDARGDGEDGLKTGVLRCHVQP